MSKRALGTYLADHLAGSLYAIELLDTCCAEYAEPELQDFFAWLRGDVQQDRDILDGILLRVGGSKSRVKEAAVWSLEKMSRVKHAEPSDTAGSGLLERLETLALGIMGKQALWQSLDAAAGDGGRFAGVEVATLQHRARRQYEQVERLRRKTAAGAFALSDDDLAASTVDERGLRGVLLDVDGTLVDTNDAHARAWAEACTEAGSRVPFERVRPLIGMGGDRLIAELTGLDPDTEEGRAVERRHAELFLQRYLEDCRPFPRVRELLEKMLARGLVLTVATSARDRELVPVLERAGVDDLVERPASADDVERSKPAADVVAAALRKHEWGPQQALLVGDTPFDVRAGRKAGVGVVAMRCGGASAPELAGAVAVYAGPAELLESWDESPFAARRGGVGA